MADLVAPRGHSAGSNEGQLWNVSLWLAAWNGEGGGGRSVEGISAGEVLALVWEHLTQETTWFSFTEEETADGLGRCVRHLLSDSAEVMHFPAPDRAHFTLVQQADNRG